jgi:hypothetical protein
MNFCHRYGTRMLAPLALMAGVLLAGAPPARAQAPLGSSLLPGIRHFESLQADVVEPRMGAGFTLTNLLATQGGERPVFDLPDPDRSRREVQGDVALGGTLPLLVLRRWEGGGLVLAGQAGVTARFRIEERSRDHLAEDWFVAIPIEARRHAWSARARIAHISSHLGDEFMAFTGAERIEYGGESLDVHVAYDTPVGARVYTGGNWIFRSYTKLVLRDLGLDRQDRFLAQAGIDGRWPVLAGGRAAVVGGVDVKLAERTNWRTQATAIGGVRVRSDHSALQLRLRIADGTSPLGEFFLTRERLFSLEFVAEL